MTEEANVSNKDNSQCIKRLINDYKKFKSDKSNKLINFAFHSDNMLEASAVILGPPDSCWENAVICLELTFSESYPAVAPKVQCTGLKPFHPNFFQDGRICLSILQGSWSSSYDIYSLLISIQSLLTDPNPSSPANLEASQLYVNDRGTYEMKVKQFAEKCWDSITDQCYIKLLEGIIEE